MWTFLKLMMSFKEAIAKEIPCEEHVWLYNWGLVWGGTRRSLQCGGVRNKGPATCDV